jgi:hypothetical protein
MNRKLAWGLMLSALLGSASIALAPTASADPPGACGAKENPCPLQKWMRQTMSAANASGDFPGLASAFEKLSHVAPDPKWNGSDAKQHWDAIARAGRDAAKASDAAGVKAACKACHDNYKDKYKANFRLNSAP